MVSINEYSSWHNLRKVVSVGALLAVVAFAALGLNAAPVSHAAGQPPATPTPTFAQLLQKAPVTTLSKSTAGLPAGTQVKEVTLPNCQQPTAALRAEALDGQLSDAELAQDGMPQRAAFVGKMAQWQSAIEHDLYRECTTYTKVGTTENEHSAPECDIHQEGCWAGYYQHGPDSHGDGEYWNFAGAEWNLPAMIDDSNPENNSSAQMVQWVGLGGIYGQLFQTGTSENEYYGCCGVYDNTYGAFVEITPAAETTFALNNSIEGLWMSYGDYVSGYVEANSDFWIEDWHTGVSAGYTYSGGGYDITTFDCMDEQAWQPTNGYIAEVSSDDNFDSCYGDDQNDNYWAMGNNNFPYYDYVIYANSNYNSLDYWPSSPPNVSNGGSFTLYSAF